MDKGLQSYEQSAKELGLPCYYDDKLALLVLTLGKKKYFITPEISPINRLGNVALSRNKFAHNELLKKDGIPVPRGQHIEYPDFHQNEFDDLIKDLNFPLNVCSNLNKLGGEIFRNFRNSINLEEHLRLGFKKYFSIYLQEIPDDLQLYQALFLNNELINIVKFKNKEPTIDYSEKSESVLLSSIPAENICFLTKIVKRLDLDLVGINFYCKNVEVSFNKSKWFFWDSEADPPIKLHEERQKNNLTKLILMQLIKRNLFFYLKTLFMKN